MYIKSKTVKQLNMCSSTSSFPSHNVKGKALRYVIKGNAVIFDSSIDEPINEYFKVISLHPILVFNNKSYGCTKYFNQPNILLPQNIKKLVLNPWYTQSLTLPKYIKYFKTNCSYKKSTLLPKTIVYLNYEHSLVEDIKLSKNIKHFFMSCEFDQIIKLSKSLTHLKCSSFFNVHLDVSKNIIYLKLGNLFNQSIDLSKNLKCLIIGLRMEKYFVLPKNVKHMVFFSSSEYIVVLTETIEKLSLCSVNYNLCDNLTDGLKCVFAGKSWIKNNKPVKTRQIIKSSLYFAY